VATTPKHGVFISFARSDGEAFAADIRRRLDAEGFALWRDRESMQGGRDWWLQITEALDGVEFMVLLMTPDAMQSATVRKEWRHARQRGVCVYPIKAVPHLDFEALPRWMRSVHFYDPHLEWTKLVNDLRTRCEQRRVPFMVEDLPPEFVPRPAEFERLVSCLLDREREEPVAITTALRAAGGYGKTVLARAVCHDEAIQNAFDDGILWVTLGENPGDLTRRVEDFIYLLSGQRPGFAGLEAATAMLVELMADRDILLVIDDVWDPAHVKPFLQGGPRCARVITTRIVDTLPSGTTRIDVDAMRQDEAAALVGHGLPSGFDQPLRALAARLGEWPLLLKLANAALQDRVRSAQPVPDALSYLNKALDKRGLTFFDARDPAARHDAVVTTLELSIERLNDAERARFTELAVFPEDVSIPLAILERFWGRTGGLDEVDTESLSDRLSRLSLTLVFDPARRYVRMHDVIRRFLIERLGDRLPLLHRELLDGNRPPSGVWADLPLADPYLWDHLAYHLKAGGLAGELVSTVRDLRYLAAKTLSRRTLGAEMDLLAAEHEAPDDVALRVLRRRFVQSSHIFNRCEGLDDLQVTMQSRLQHLDELAPLTGAFAKSLGRSHITALRSLPDLPHPALIRTFVGGRTTVWGCAVSPDASFLVSASYDGSLTIWDARTATERRRLTGHSAWVRRCAVSPDGSLVVSASDDRRVRVWEAATGAVRLVLSGHTDGVTDCAVSGDGAFIVSSSLDETVKVWDVQTGATRHTLGARWEEVRGGWLRQSLPGHAAAVWSCAISPDNHLIASASSDQTLKIWDPGTGTELRTLVGHEAVVNACAFSPDGSLLASAGADETVRLWDLMTGEQRFVLTGHTGAVNRCAFSPDGTWIVSVAADESVRIWSTVSGDVQASYFGHTDVVNDCAIATDGSYIVSASLDGTLKMWDATRAGAGVSATQHRAWVNGCAVSADGSLVVSASSDMTLKLWSAEAGAATATLSGHENSVRGCAVGPGSGYVVSASADKSLKVWDAVQGTAVTTLLGHRDWVNRCCVSPSGHLLLSASSDKTVRLWDARTWAKRLSIVAHGDSVNACAFSPDSLCFVSASTDATLKIWDVTRAREVWESPPVGHERFTADGWQMVLRPMVLAGHTGSVNDCAVAPDGSFIVSASSDRTLRVWDAVTGGLRATLSGHRDAVTGCAVSRDGQLIASASDDKTVKVWMSNSGECLSTLHVDGGLSDCAWFPDSERLVAVGAAGVYLLAVSVGR
jgi:WD40 repeat protein